MLRCLEARGRFFESCHHNGNKLQACRDYTFTVVSTTNNELDKKKQHCDKHNQQQAGQKETTLF